MAISPRLSTARPGAASRPRGGPAPPHLARALLNIRRLGFQSLSLRQHVAGTIHFEPGGVFFDTRAHPCFTKRVIAPADAQPRSWRAR
jgi:hypothetical protein